MIFITDMDKLFVIKKEDMSTRENFIRVKSREKEFMIQRFTNIRGNG